MAGFGENRMAKTFLETISTIPNSVLVVDGFNLCFRYKHNGTKKFTSSYIDTVKSFAKSYKCEHIIVAADLGSSSYRKALYPEYKGNRQELRDKQTEQEKEDFQEFYTEYLNALDCLEYEDITVLKYDKVEADDIAAFIVKHKKELGISTIWLISSDRDWDLLVSSDVSRFSYVTRKETTLDTWPYDVTVDEYISYKCLVGDSGDNIKGIKGIGDKRAVSLIKEYGSVFDIYDACPINDNKKFIAELNNNRELLMLNLELMDLLTYCDEAIGVDNCNDILARLEFINESSS